MELSNELREKIRRRARRAYDGATVHRCKLIEGVVFYRLGSGRPLVTVRQDKLGRLYVPRSV